MVNDVLIKHGLHTLPVRKFKQRVIEFVHRIETESARPNETAQSSASSSLDLLGFNIPSDNKNLHVSVDKSRKRPATSRSGGAGLLDAEVVHGRVGLHPLRHRGQGPRALREHQQQRLVHDADRWKPPCDEAVHPYPVQPSALAAAL